jgi:hypothetical protein
MIGLRCWKCGRRGKIAPERHESFLYAKCWCGAISAVDLERGTTTACTGGDEDWRGAIQPVVGWRKMYEG